MDKPTVVVTVPFSFVWSEVKPDPREWKPSAPILNPVDAIIVVDVPLQREYVYNSERIIQEQISPTSKYTIPILTPAGMKFCVDTLENAMREYTSPKSSWDVSADNDDPWADQD